MVRWLLPISKGINESARAILQGREKTRRNRAADYPITSQGYKECTWHWMRKEEKEEYKGGNDNSEITINSNKQQAI